MATTSPSTAGPRRDQGCQHPPPAGRGCGFGRRAGLVRHQPQSDQVAGEDQRGDPNAGNVWAEVAQAVESQGKKTEDPSHHGSPVACAGSRHQGLESPPADPDQEGQAQTETQEAPLGEQVDILVFTPGEDNAMIAVEEGGRRGGETPQARAPERVVAPGPQGPGPDFEPDRVALGFQDRGEALLVRQRVAENQ